MALVVVAAAIRWLEPTPRYQGWEKTPEIAFNRPSEAAFSRPLVSPCRTQKPGIGANSVTH
jgi:hypothetical protein